MNEQYDIPEASDAGTSNAGTSNAGTSDTRTSDARTSDAGPDHRGKRGRKTLALTGAAGLLAGALGAGLWVGVVARPSGNGSSPVTVQVPSQSAQAGGAAKSVSTIAAGVTPGVVDINTTVASPASEGQSAAAGTGMIITSSGEVLTNNHVVRDATSIRVMIQGRDRTYPARVLGVDPGSDVALLQIEGVSGSLPTIPLGNSASAAVGDAAVAIGNALGRGGQPAVVTGRITGLDKTDTASDQGVTTSSETLHHLIQTDADIVPGDSGGPLVNSHGQVIAMDTAAATGPNGTTTGLAIPINSAISVANQIATGSRGGGILSGESPYLGIFEQVGADGRSAGVYVSDVARDGPAQRAGIQGGDTITAMNGHPTASIAGLRQVISALQPGQRVTITFVDGLGATHTADVTLAGLPA